MNFWFASELKCRIKSWKVRTENTKCLVRKTFLELCAGKRNTQNENNFHDNRMVTPDDVY